MNTLNFKNQQMKELSIDEMQKVEGGLGPFLVFGIAALGTYALLALGGSSDCAEGVNDQNGVNCN